jgi:hypothetical protein
MRNVSISLEATGSQCLVLLQALPSSAAYHLGAARIDMDRVALRIAGNAALGTVNTTRRSLFVVDAGDRNELSNVHISARGACFFDVGSDGIGTTGLSEALSQLSFVAAVVLCTSPYISIGSSISNFTTEFRDGHFVSRSTGSATAALVVFQEITTLSNINVYVEDVDSRNTLGAPLSLDKQGRGMCLFCLSSLTAVNVFVDIHNTSSVNCRFEPRPRLIFYHEPLRESMFTTHRWSTTA